MDRNTWHRWLAEDFRKRSDVSGCELLLREDVALAGEGVPTPLTKFAGFRRLLVLCIQRSAVAQAVADEALRTLGRVRVGDETLVEEVAANHAAMGASGEAGAAARAFVLGSPAAAEPEAPTVLEDFGAGGVHAAFRSGILEAVGRPGEARKLCAWHAVALRGVAGQNSFGRREAEAAATSAARIAELEAKAAGFGARKAEFDAKAAGFGARKAEFDAKAKKASTEARAAEAAAASAARVASLSRPRPRRPARAPPLQEDPDALLRHRGSLHRARSFPIPPRSEEVARGRRLDPAVKKVAASTRPAPKGRQTSNHRPAPRLECHRAAM